MGFNKGFHAASNNQMELPALLEGLKLAENQNLRPEEINVDSREIILMLKNGNLHYDFIIDACRYVLRMIGRPPIVHCFREQNSVADTLANKEAMDKLFGTTNILAIPSMYAQKFVSHPLF